MYSIPIYKLNRLMFAICMAILFYYCLNLFIGFYNPDWVVYERIFIDGSHLKDMGRDFGYLFINKVFKFFSNSYESFRHILSLFFCYFIFTFIRGKSFSFCNEQRNYFVLSFFVIALFFVRFSIQIREGLALCILISIFNDIFESKKDGKYGFAFGISFFVKFLAAYLIHGGTSFFFIIFLISYLLYFLTKKSRLVFFWAHKNRNTILISASIVTSFIMNKFANKFYFLPDEIQLLPSNYNVSKILYWVFNGCMMILLIKKAYELILKINNKFSKIFFILINNYLLVFIYILILTSILLNSAGGLISTLSRIYNLALSISLLILVTKSNKHNKFIFIYSAFLIIDQIRIVIEAFTFQNLMYYNGEL